MTKLFDEISAGLREAITHAKGGKTGLMIHEFRAPDLHVGAVREQTALSRTDRLDQVHRHACQLRSDRRQEAVRGETKHGHSSHQD
jgi:hypothetical protein